MSEPRFVVAEQDPGRPNLRFVGGADTFEAARKLATELNRRLSAEEGEPERAPFRFYFATARNGAHPGRSLVGVRQEDGE